MLQAQHNLLVLTAMLLLTMSAAAGEFPDNWYWERPEEHTKFEGFDAPDLTVGEWVGGAFDVSKMKGQIVVIDFWATWSNGSIKGMPLNSKLAEKYADDGVKLIGICTNGEAEKMPTLVKDNNAKYPNAFAKGDQIEKDWPVPWYSTYAVLDREGVVRAIGLKADHVKDVIEALLEQEAQADGKVRIRPNWLEGTSEKRARLKRLEKKPQSPPALMVESWHNSKRITLKKLKGKVVVLDFWATWSPSNEKTIPKHNALLEKYGEDGLVIIGVCATLGSEAIKEAIEGFGINYPVCIDIENKTNTAYAPNGYSDYYLIDRSGTLRIADCTNKALEAAIKALLSEEPPEEEAEPDEEAGKVG